VGLGAMIDWGSYARVRRSAIQVRLQTCLHELRPHPFSAIRKIPFNGFAQHKRMISRKSRRMIAAPEYQLIRLFDDRKFLDCAHETPKFIFQKIPATRER
jgi:hypothetical protein